MSADDMNHTRLAAAMRVVADADTQLGASPDVRSSLGAEVRARATRARRRRGAAWVAAAVVLAVSASVWRVADEERPASASSAASYPAQREMGEPFPNPSDGFLPLPYANVPATEGRIVQLQVPGLALTAFGLQPTETESRGTVLADVFVGEDGLARAVRFIRASDVQEQVP